MPIRDPWFFIPRPVSDPLIRLFCLQHAGGSAVAYHSWAKRLPDSVEMAAVQLPGRVYRLKEEPFVRMEPLVESLTAALDPYLDRPFAIFGHSMGALVGFEVARRLRTLGLSAPCHLIASGRRAPQVPNSLPELHRLPDAEFRKALHDLFGMPAKQLEDEALMEMSKRALRADFEVIETWKWTPEPPLSTPITAIGGCSDPTLSYSGVEAWRDQTSGSFDSRWFPGGHYYVAEREEQVVKLVAAILSQAPAIRT